MLGEALEYPRRGEKWLERVGIGGGLIFLSFIVPLLPQLVVFGHGKRVLSRSIEGNPDPPEFDDWEGLFVDGLKLYAVILLYTVVPMMVIGLVVFVLWILLFLVVGGLASAGGSEAGGILGVIGTLGFLVVFLLIFALMMAIYYFVPAGMLRFAARDDIGAALDWSGIRRLSFSGEYFRAWLLAVVVGFGSGILTTVLFFTIVGILVVPFVQFYVQMAVFRIFGNAYDDVMGTGGEPASGDRESTWGSAETQY